MLIVAVATCAAATGFAVGYLWTVARMVRTMRKVMKEGPAAPKTPGAMVETEVTGRHENPSR